MGKMKPMIVCLNFEILTACLSYIQLIRKLVVLQKILQYNILQWKTPINMILIWPISYNTFCIETSLNSKRARYDRYTARVVLLLDWALL